MIRVTGYLVKKSEVEKYRKGEVALRDTTWYGSGTDDCAQVFDRQLRDEQDVVPARKVRVEKFFVFDRTYSFSAFSKIALCSRINAINGCPKRSNLIAPTPLIL